ncbi:MAG: hypothetical protein JNL58_07860 [Planctomyces sp.]|nr:hypothetical protein [Planctomyces sp.]
MRYLIYEDSLVSQLNPIAMTRPVFELLCGRDSLRRRLERWFPAEQNGVWIRSWLKEVYSEEHPQSKVNDFSWLSQAGTLLINGRWIPEKRFQTGEVSPGCAGFVNGELAWIFLEPEELNLLSETDFDTIVLQLARMRKPVRASGILAKYPWDLVSENRRQLVRDFLDEGMSQAPQSEHVVVLGDQRDIYVAERSMIDPFVVLDTRTGPISIDRDVHIQSFTRIEGPCHIGRGTKIFRALIRSGTTIGDHCRVGGEIEESILHGFVNKYHDGFLGHSYVCPWVNLGAMTSTSDLRHDYSEVRVPLQGEQISSHLTKVGSFIGDHSRTAIDSMFNTGSSIGIMTMVLPGGRLLPRYIPSFCNVSFGELAADWPLETSIATAAIAMTRRGQKMTPAMARLFRILYQQTEQERQTALAKATHRRITLSK